MRQSSQQETYRTFDDLSRQQLLIYAREFGEYRQRERQLKDALSRRNLQVQEMAAASYKAQEQERQSIAFEVHDRIAQSLVLVSQRLQTLESMTQANKEMRTAVSRASDVLQEALYECRNIMNDLHAPVLEQHDIVALIKEGLYRLQQDLGCRVESYMDDPVILSPDVEIALYRISQEALMNIRRHASSARNVTVTLRCKRDLVTFQVQDDGPGFDAEAVAQPVHVGGITGMRRRAEAIGGSLEVASFPGHGARVTACVPITDDHIEEISVRNGQRG